MPRSVAGHQPAVHLPLGDNLEYRDGFAVVSVAQAVTALRELINDALPFLWVRGEISGLKRSGAGHYYFTLKDDSAALQCVMFRAAAASLVFTPEEGMAVVVGGSPDIYSERGQLQLVVRRMEPEGVGALALAFEQLKARLAAEGLFAAERKRALPPYPRTVGVVTSPTGAVIRDILEVSYRRHRGIDIVIASTRVQGEGAEVEVVQALTRLVRRGGIDVVIIARGGGSLEDLSPFNSELVARAIASCPLPVVSAVGHETDTTIADLVADLRAPTPSAAAELVFPSLADMRLSVDREALALRAAMIAILASRRERIATLRARLRHPRRRLEERRQQLDDRSARLLYAARRTVQTYKERLSQRAATLDALSPLKVLGRGYALVLGSDGPITRVRAMAPGMQVQLKLRDGEAAARIDTVHTADA